MKLIQETFKGMNSQHNGHMKSQIKNNTKILMSKNNKFKISKNILHKIRSSKKGALLPITYLQGFNTKACQWNLLKRFRTK